MKNNTSVFLIGLFLTLPLLSTAYFYQKNATAIRAEAEDLFVGTLTSKLHKKVVEADLFYSFISSSDTIPLTISITTEDGIKEYEVDAGKSRKNISQSPSERSLHTVICEESPLLADSLNELWADTLRVHHIGVRTAIHVSAVTLRDEVVASKSAVGREIDASSSRFVSYVGNRCEIEVTGLLDYSWWMVCLYHWSPFLWIWVGAVSVLALLYSLYRFAHRPGQIEIVKEEVIREIVKEVPVSVCAKEPDSVNLKIYQLQSGLLFDARRQVLVLNGTDSELAPQSCVILRIFLDAPDYTLTDAEILNSVWGKQDTTIKNFTAACARLRKSLAKVGFEVYFKRVGRNQYRMVMC